MNLDDDEVAVVCSTCNGYLYSTDVFDERLSMKEVEDRVTLIPCPYHKPEYPLGDRCQPPTNEGRYGRS